MESKTKKKTKTSTKFIPLKSFKPITNEKQARKATSEFHRGEYAQQNRTKYQQASALLTNVHKTTSKFVFRTITKLNLCPKRHEPKLKTLEVGAVNTQLVDSSFLSVNAIDLKSRHPLIKEQDFFKLKPEGQYDLVVLAMVLNCVPSAKFRGIMLQNCRLHLKQDGLLFLILPSRCFPDNKREEFEREIMLPLGFEVVLKESSPKVVSTCFKAVEKNFCPGQTLTFSDGGELLDIIVSIECEGDNEGRQLEAEPRKSTKRSKDIEQSEGTKLPPAKKSRESLKQSADRF
jgi:hypothetical protein